MAGGLAAVVDGSRTDAAPILAFGDREYTRAEIDALVSGMATMLEHRGVRVGDRVALVSSNRPEFVVAMLGVWALGAAVVAAVTRCAPVEEDEPILLVADRLASHERPSRVLFVPEIPRLPSGKLLRRVLKERLWTSA